MSRVLFVSERASLGCGQIFDTLTQASGLHRRVAPARAFTLSPLCTRHKRFECVNRDTRVSTPILFDCVPTTHGFNTYQSHCVPPQHNACITQIQASAMSTLCEVLVILSSVWTHVSTV